MKRISPSRLPVFLFLPLSLFACKRAPVAPDTNDAGAAAPSASTTPDAGTVVARCKLDEAKSSTLADVGDRRSLVVGEGVATADGSGFVAGVVRSPASGAEALVARVSGSQVVEEWVVAKHAELVPDAAPPKPLVAAGALYAALLVRGAAGSRQIVLAKSGAAAPVASFAARTDESLAFDAALSADASRAALVWDDDATTAGGITVASVPLGGARPAAPRVVSGDTADPDGPHVAPRAAGGWWVAWTAHRPEVADAGARAQAAIEAPAEERAYSWVEIVAVGDDGAPAGAPRRITPALGHAASFDLAPRASGELDVVVRDETQSREGEGGRVVHLVVRADGGVDEPAVLVPSGVSRGSIDLVTGAAGGAWLAFSDAQDRTLVVPLGPTRAALGPPSVENALEGGRLLALATAGSPALFVAAFPGADGALFREVACAP